jgi:hypothetical protein
MVVMLAALLFLVMLTTIGIHILQTLVETPDHTGDADRA